MLKGTLLYLAQNTTLRDFVTRNRATRAVSRRFVAGEALDSAIEATRALNLRGMHVSLDHLGENVSGAKEATSAAQDYITILDRIKQTGVDANISIKLTALGLDISQELCEQNTCRLLEYAQQFPIFVRIDMEGSAYTDATLRIFEEVQRRHGNAGLAIQAYLHRSQPDLERLAP